MNKAILCGRLVRDPEVKYSQTGVAITNFTIAIDRPSKKDEPKQADFINCVAFQKQAEFIGNYFQKGRKMLLEGRIQTRNYENKEGKKVYVTEVIVNSVEFADSKPEAPQQAATTPTPASIPAQQPQAQQQGFNQFGNTVFDESIPF